MMPKTVLIVDDEEIFRTFLRALLEEHGYSVVEASDGNAALQLLEHRTVDLAITDLVMPRVEGIETICAIRKKTAALPILAISGAFGSPEYLHAAFLLGASSVMEKLRIPFDLPATIEKLLA